MGSGTTADPNSYEAINKNVLPGTHYYKLSKVDFDGTKTHLGIIEVIQYATSVHPNPTNKHLNFSNNGQALVNLEIAITDVTGRQVANFTQNQIETTDLGYRFDVAFLTSGIYFVTVTGDKFQHVEKFVVEK